MSTKAIKVKFIVLIESQYGAKTMAVPTIENHEQCQESLHSDIISKSLSHGIQRTSRRLSSQSCSARVAKIIKAGTSGSYFIISSSSEAQMLSHLLQRLQIL